MCTQKQIRNGVEQCLTLMGGSFDLQALRENDACYDWEFRQMPNLMQRHGIEGLYSKDGPLVTVIWDEQLPIAQKYKTIAHELGHHFLHRNLPAAAEMLEQVDVSDGHQIAFSDRRESEAEEFAKRLLSMFGIEGEVEGE